MSLPNSVRATTLIGAASVEGSVTSRVHEPGCGFWIVIRYVAPGLVVVESMGKKPLANVAVVGSPTKYCVPFGARSFKPPEVPMSDFMALTKIPIVIYYGDNIPESASTNPGQEQWRVFLQVARLWRDAVNRHGGDVTVVHLPELGIRGNTHFPMSDLNNVQVADHLSQYLASKGLDR